MQLVCPGTFGLSGNEAIDERRAHGHIECGTEFDVVTIVLHGRKNATVKSGGVRDRGVWFWRAGCTDGTTPDSQWRWGKA